MWCDPCALFRFSPSSSYPPFFVPVFYSYPFFFQTPFLPQSCFHDSGHGQALREEGGLNCEATHDPPVACLDPRCASSLFSFSALFFSSFLFFSFLPSLGPVLSSAPCVVLPRSLSSLFEKYDAALMIKRGRVCSIHEAPWIIKTKTKRITKT